MNRKNGFEPRQKARKYALQALYSWKLSGNNLKDVESHILEGKNTNKIDLDHFHRLLHQIPAKTNEINEIIKPHLNLEIEKVGVIELTVLQIAVVELTECPDIPYKVVINEALELTKKFGATESHKFINGVLDKVSKKLKN